MNRNFLRIIACLTAFSILYNFTFACDGPMRTMQKGTNFESTFLQEYLRYFDCQSDHGNEDWQFYSVECMKNDSCVGIRSDTPSAAICIVTSHPQDENLSIEDMWIMVNEFERFEGMRK